jgi:hypothetical protein
MGKTNAKMCSHKATQVLPLSKGTPAVGIASSSYFAACARHVGALALFGLMFCPVQVMASRAPRLAVADSSEVVSPVLPDQVTTTPTDSIGNGGAGDTDQVLPDTIPFAQLWKHNSWQSTNEAAESTTQQSWEIICNRPTKLTFNYSCNNRNSCTFQVTLNDSTIISKNSWSSTEGQLYQIDLPAGRYVLKASYYTYYENQNENCYAQISGITTDDAQIHATAYLGALADYPPLKQELQTALDNYNAAPDDEALYNTLAATLNDVRTAVSYYPLIQKDIVVADSILNEGAYVDISEAVALGRAIDVNTSTSADYLAAFEALETSIAVQVSSNQKIDDWAFNTNQRYTIDNMGYYLDQDHKVAACTGLEAENADVTDLVIPSTVRYNGVTYAVVALYDNRYNQNKVRTLTLPRTLRHINDWGLSDYRAITDLEIPANVERMGDYIVNNCPQLQRIKVNAEVPPTLGSLDNDSYYEDGYNIYHYLRIVIPRESFHAYRLVSAWNTDHNVLIGGDEGITVNTGKIAAGDLGHVVVEEAGYLQEVNKLIIEGELNSDDWSKIKQMTNLTELDLSKALIDEIPSEAFNGRWAIDKVVLPPTLKKIGSYAFQRTSLTSVNIPDNVETIEDCAFGRVKQLQEVHLPDSLTALGGSAFEYCRNLRAVKIPSKIKVITWHAFRYCSSLQSVELHDSITGFGDYSFSNCNLREITLPKSTTAVGNHAFEGNANLSKVTLNEGLISIGENAFYNTAIDTLNCPSTLRNLYNAAFARCYNLRQINLNEGLKRIGVYALADNMATEIVLPSSLEYCAGGAFSNCNSLVTIEVRSVMPPNTDGGCPLTVNDLTKAVLYVPVWSLAEYQLATGWNKFYTFRTSDFMPQYVKVNKDFYFTLRDELAPDYRPDIELTVTNNQITDSHNNSDYQHGNLTISGRSKLAVNDFSMVLSPYAKYSYEGGGYNHKNDYRYLRPTSLIVKGEMRAENVTINLWNATNRWQFVSFPFDVKVSDIVPVDSTTSWVIRGHSGAERAAGNAAAVWQNLSADDVLQAGKGYIMQCYKPNDKNGNYYAAQFTVRPLTTTVNRQQIFNADNRTVALEEHLAEFEHNRSWNLIGNPYPSYFDTRFLDFTAPFMVWNSNNQNYEAYSPVDDSYILAPAEAFFVQRPVDQENITFLKDGRQTDRYARTLVEEEPASAPQRIRAAYDSNTHTAAQRTVFNITLAKDGQQADRTRVVINEAATMQYDLSRDAAKFTGTEPAVSQIFTINGATRYAINERPLNNGQALLGLHFGTDGTYTIGLSNQPDGQVTLEDRLTGTKLQLNGTAGYSFTAKAGDSTDRFVLHFDAVATGINAATTNEADRNDDTYTLDGRKVNNPTAPGLYIKGGKKVIK